MQAVRSGKQGCSRLFDGNPFDSELARASSAYAKFEGGRLVRVMEPDRELTPCQQGVHDDLRAFLLDPQFSCVGAKAAFNGGTYRMGVYSDMADTGALAGLARDLSAFVQEQESLGSDFTTFMASFLGPHVKDEAGFEAHLWDTLQTLYDVDRLYSPSDPGASDDPASGEFGFSFAGRAFFVVGLHPASSRLARRFAWPTLVFNAHSQFDHLKADGRYGKMQAAIRARELSWQGSLNPNLAAFGEASEARQYAGRAVEDEWRCPFHVHAAEGRRG
jgi:FPC/CPF motif-containing protein YcgG